MTGSRTKAENEKHYRDYQSRPDVMKKRALMNKARRMMEEKHGAAALKGKDVDHIRPLRSGGGTAMSNLRIVSKKKNRGWERD